MRLESGSLLQHLEQLILHDIKKIDPPSLERIDPNWEIVSEQEEQALREWHETAKRIALRIGQELVESAGTAAIVGRAVKDKNDKERIKKCQLIKEY